MSFPAHALISGPTHQPSTGFGRFVASYKPDANIITVKVKVLWDWINFDPNAKPWDDARIQAFKTQFARNISAAWDKKWRFRCIKPGFTQYLAEPVFQIADGSTSDHHIRIGVRNGHGESYLDDSHGFLVLHETDNDEYDNVTPPSMIHQTSLLSQSRSNLILIARRKLEDLIVPVQTIALQHTSYGWTIDNASRPALSSFANELKRISDMMPHFPINLKTPGHVAGNGQALVSTVLNFLRSQGVDTEKNRFNSITEPSKETSSKYSDNSPTAYVYLSLPENNEEVADNWHYRYKVASHEFGHCLGLPDEYRTYPAGALQDFHNRWTSLCNQAAVLANPYPVFSNSLMSCGWITHACHYVTIWEALGQITQSSQFNIQASEWVIERGTQADVI